MALRLLEVTVPEDQLEGIPALVEDLRMIQYWVAATTDGIGTGRFLLDAGDAEALSDRLVSRYGSEEGFRLVLLPVEATLPAVEDAPRPAGPPDGESTSDPGPPRRISREELYEDVSQASRVTPVYLTMVALSAVVAAVGLIRGDVAIVIGAMVIAPLLGPNIALSLAATLGDLELARRSSKAVGSGLLTVAAISVPMGMVFAVDPASAELAARTSANFGDIAIALSAGTAGALAFTSGVPAVVVGVMVAVALLPPSVAAGLFIGAGHERAALGALTLLITNVTCVNLAAVGTFLAQRVRPRTWWEADRARKATWIAVTAWILMLVVLVGLIWLRSFRAV